MQTVPVPPEFFPGLREPGLSLREDTRECASSTCTEPASEREPSGLPLMAQEPMESPGQREQAGVFSVMMWLFNKAVRPQGLS